MRRKFKLLFTLAVGALFVISCSTGTSLTSVWKNEYYKGGKLNRTMIIGAAKKPDIRQMFEDEFVKQLRAKGADGVASYTFLQGDKMQDKDTILKHVNDLNVDSVLLTKLITDKDAATYVTPHDRNLHTQYSESQTYVFEHGYIDKEQPVKLETNLYDARTEKLIWSALSDTFKRGSDDETIESFIKKITEQLSKQNLI